MKKGLKIAAITVGVIIILMFLLPFAFQGKIADIVKTEGNKMLNAQFDFKNLNISLFRNFPQASVTLEDFWLKGTGEFANDTLVQAGEVTEQANVKFLKVKLRIEHLVAFCFYNIGYLTLEGERKKEH